MGGGHRGSSKTRRMMKEGSGYIGLVDCNNFFVSCERLFRPDLAKRPVLVLSSNDGCAISRSKEVKELGIPMGIPLFQIREHVRKHKIAVFSSNFPLYRDISGRVMSVVSDVVDECEVYSIDESFFSVSETKSDSVGVVLRQRILTDVGIPVSVGIARTKTLAKLAASFAKGSQQGVHVIMSEEEVKYHSTSLNELWGVGRATSERLTRAGIVTIADLLSAGPSRARALLGLHGEQLYFELSGVPSISGEHGLSSSMTSSRSFGTATTSFSVLESALSYHVAHLAERLRRNEVQTAHVNVVLYQAAQGRGFGVGADAPLSEPTSDTRVLTSRVIKAAKELYRSDVRYKKVGVTFGGIVPSAQSTGSLFSDPHTQERPVLMDTIDRISQRYGRGAVRLGTEGMGQVWRSKEQYRSPSYTTSWGSIPHVRNEL